MVINPPEIRPAAGQSGLHAKLLDELGRLVCSGDIEPGEVLTVDALAEKHGVSRSVVREVLRVLSSMGLVDARRRVGTVVCESREWNAFDPQVIRWRLASQDRIAQLRSLIEVRAAIEPMAAALAAARAAPRSARELVGLAAQLRSAGEVGDVDEFVRIDIEFHQQVLRLSGNDMFAQLQDLVAEVLRGRHYYGLTSQYQSEHALRHHADVAQAIASRDGDRARVAMAEAMDDAWGELSSLWESGDAKRLS